MQPEAEKRDERYQGFSKLQQLLSPFGPENQYLLLACLSVHLFNRVEVRFFVAILPGLGRAIPFLLTVAQSLKHQNFQSQLKSQKRSHRLSQDSR